MKKVISIFCVAVMLCTFVGCSNTGSNTVDKEQFKTKEKKEIVATVETSEDDSSTTVLPEESESVIIKEFNHEDSYLAVDYLSLDFNGTNMLFPAMAKEFCTSQYWMYVISNSTGNLSDMPISEAKDISYCPLVDVSVSDYMSGDSLSADGIVDRVEMTIAEDSSLSIFDANYTAESDLEYIIAHLGKPEEIRIDSAGTRYVLYSFGKGAIEFVFYPEQSTLGCIILSAIDKEPISVEFGYEVIDYEIVD